MFEIRARKRVSLGWNDLFFCCRTWSPRVFGIRARKRMSLRELDLFGVIGLLGVVSVLRAFISRHPRLPRERRKKERKRERKKERKKERERETRNLTYPLHILISLRVFFPHFFLAASSQQKTHIDRVLYPEQRRRRPRPSCVPRRAFALRRSSGALGEVRSASVDDASWGCLIIESIERAMSPR